MKLLRRSAGHSFDKVARPQRNGSCLTCFKSPAKSTANNVEEISGVVAGPETAITDTEAAVNGTDYLLATSPIRLTSMGSERKSGRFKKTNGLLNGNINALPDRGSFPGKDLATQISDNDLNKLFEEYNFVDTCDVTQYDDTEAWPSLFDDFVKYEQEQLKLASSKNLEGGGVDGADGVETSVRVPEYDNNNS